MAPMIAYTLPAMQLVCNLVIPGAPRPNISNLDSKPTPLLSENLNISRAESSAGLSLDVTPTSDPAVTESPKIKEKILPDGYQRFPELGVAFKYHRSEKVIWRVAAKKCVEEGGNLVVTDSQRKFDVVKSLLLPGDTIHVGITRMYESGDWVDFRTGSPVPDAPWYAGDPDGNSNRYCAQMKKEHEGLRNYPCKQTEYFVCEIEI